MRFKVLHPWGTAQMSDASPRVKLDYTSKGEFKKIKLRHLSPICQIISKLVLAPPA
jgi:hypothetical protein